MKRPQGIISWPCPLFWANLSWSNSGFPITHWRCWGRKPLKPPLNQRKEMPCCFLPRNIVPVDHLDNERDLGMFLRGECNYQKLRPLSASCQSGKAIKTQHRKGLCFAKVLFTQSYWFYSMVFHIQQIFSIKWTASYLSLWSQGSLYFLKSYSSWRISENSAPASVSIWDQFLLQVDKTWDSSLQQRKAWKFKH